MWDFFKAKFTCPQRTDRPLNVSFKDVIPLLNGRKLDRYYVLVLSM